MILEISAQMEQIDCEGVRVYGSYWDEVVSPAFDKIQKKLDKVMNKL